MRKYARRHFTRTNDRNTIPKFARIPILLKIAPIIARDIQLSHFRKKGTREIKTVNLVSGDSFSVLAGELLLTSWATHPFNDIPVSEVHPI